MKPVKKIKQVKQTKPRGRPRKIKTDEFNDESLNYWGDAPKYANDFYGDTARYTTQFDNDWN